MKIIDNKKDYYDFLVGKYGIDELIVFDRRNSVYIQTNIVPKNYIDFMFSNVKSEKDCYPTTERNYQKFKRGWKKINDKKGKVYHYILKVGDLLYLFQVERYLIDNDNVKVQTRLIDVQENKGRLYDDCPLAILPLNDFHFHFLGHNDKLLIKKRHIIEKEIIKMPFLKNTPIPKFISPEEIYFDIYNYLSAKKEKKFEDKRTDIQKIVSKGFDTKMSFRKIK